MMESTEVAAMVKSCIISRKGGVPLHELANDFKELVGEHIPFKRLGHESLMQYLCSLPGVRVDDNMVTATSANTKHIEQMINRQKVKNDNYKKRYKPYAAKSHYNKENKKYKKENGFYRKHDTYKHRDYNSQNYGYRNANYLTEQNNNYNERYQYTRYWDTNPNYYNKGNNYYNKYNNIYSQDSYIDTNNIENKQNNYYKNDDYSRCESSNSNYSYSSSGYKSHNQGPVNLNKFYELKDQLTDVYANFAKCVKPKTYFDDPHMCPDCVPSWGRLCLYHQMCDIENKMSAYIDSVKTVTNMSFEGIDFTNDDFFSDLSNGCYINDYEIIGDELMLEMLSKKNTGSVKESHLCAPGMTLKRALCGVRRYGSKKRMLIALGSADVLKKSNAHELILDMRQLIQELNNNDSKVVVCTLPPNPGFRRETHLEVATFNKYLLTELKGADIVHLSSRFKKSSQVKRELFSSKPKLSGLHSWNSDGCKVVAKELDDCLK